VLTLAIAALVGYLTVSRKDVSEASFSVG
jgi:hypothetical protein